MERGAPPRGRAASRVTTVARIAPRRAGSRTENRPSLRTSTGAPRRGPRRRAPRDHRRRTAPRRAPSGAILRRTAAGIGVVGSGGSPRNDTACCPGSDVDATARRLEANDARVGGDREAPSAREHAESCGAGARHAAAVSLSTRSTRAPSGWWSTEIRPRESRSRCAATVFSRTVSCVASDTVTRDRSPIARVAREMASVRIVSSARSSCPAGSGSQPPGPSRSSVPSTRSSSTSSRRSGALATAGAASPPRTGRSSPAHARPTPTAAPRRRRRRWRRGGWSERARRPAARDRSRSRRNQSRARCAPTRAAPGRRRARAGARRPRRAASGARAARPSPLPFPRRFVV